MIDCLGSNVLQYISAVINQLMINCGLKDMVEFVRLLNQLMAKFKVCTPPCKTEFVQEQMYPVMDDLLMKLIERLFKFSAEISQSSASSGISKHPSE
jgi:hypothetical protein